MTSSAIRVPEDWKPKLEEIESGIYLVTNAYEGAYAFFKKDTEEERDKKSIESVLE